MAVNAAKEKIKRLYKIQYKGLYCPPPEYTRVHDDIRQKLMTFNNIRSTSGSKVPKVREVISDC